MPLVIAHGLLQRIAAGFELAQEIVRLPQFSGEVDTGEFAASQIHHARQIQRREHGRFSALSCPDIFLSRSSVSCLPARVQSRYHMNADPQLADGLVAIE